MGLSNKKLAKMFPKDFKMGRPSILTDEVAEEIFFRMGNGESLRSICRDEHMPNIATVWRWTHSNEEFCKRYEVARMQLVDTYAAEVSEIADDSTNDFYEKALKNGEVAVVGNGELVQRARLRVETRRWVCERMAPHKYGEKSSLNLGGQVENPVKIDVSTMSKEELAQFLITKLHAQHDIPK